MAVKDDLREMRLEKRRTQSEVAKQMGISQSAYSKIEQGLDRRSVSEALKTVNIMRTKSDRTAGGDSKAGRKK
jgi:transcriptional regulator with XRE-family HTH domain